MVKFRAGPWQRSWFMWAHLSIIPISTFYWEQLKSTSLNISNTTENLLILSWIQGNSSKLCVSDGVDIVSGHCQLPLSYWRSLGVRQLCIGIYVEYPIIHGIIFCCLFFISKCKIPYYNDLRTGHVELLWFDKVLLSTVSSLAVIDRHCKALLSDPYWYWGDIGSCSRFVIRNKGLVT